MKQLVLATQSVGKIKELTELLAPIQCIPQQQLNITEIAETGLSFVENALIKARHASQCSGRPALADDSGLVIDALQGEPGIYSARYAGEPSHDTENIKKVLQKLQGVNSRQAYFFCVLVLMRYPSDPSPLIAMGQLNGVIAESCQGTQGFGYDPIFYLPDYQCTLAQLALGQKNKISHRAQAIQKLLRLI